MTHFWLLYLIVHGLHASEKGHVHPYMTKMLPFSDGILKLSNVPCNKPQITLNMKIRNEDYTPNRPKKVRMIPTYQPKIAFIYVGD